VFKYEQPEVVVAISRCYRIDLLVLQLKSMTKFILCSNPGVSDAASIHLANTWAGHVNEWRKYLLMLSDGHIRTTIYPIALVYTSNSLIWER
jgi:hypothetical protein